MLMCPVDRLASFSSGSAMMAEQSAIWAVNIEKCTENDRWPPVIYSSDIRSQDQQLGGEGGGGVAEVWG